MNELFTNKKAKCIYFQCKCVIQLYYSICTRVLATLFSVFDELFPTEASTAAFFQLTIPTYLTFTAQKMKFSIKDFFSKCDQTRGFGHFY